MLTFSTDTPECCGIVQTDPNGVVQEFHEKVCNPPGNCANGAVYVFDTKLLTILKDMNNHFQDFILCCHF